MFSLIGRWHRRSRALLRLGLTQRPWMRRPATDRLRGETRNRDSTGVPEPGLVPEGGGLVPGEDGALITSVASDVVGVLASP